MHLLPASHGRGFYKHDAPVDFHIDYGMVDVPNADDVRVIPHTSWERVALFYQQCLGYYSVLLGLPYSLPHIYIYLETKPHRNSYMNMSRLSVFLEHPSLLLFAQNLSLHGESLETRLVFPQVMPIILDPGDALIFHGELAHYTPPNVTTTRSAIFVYKPLLFAKKKSIFAV